MNKEKRQKRFIQKARNHDKWIKRQLERVRWVGQTTLEDHDEKIANMLANHGKLCSCAGCGNPRRHFSETTIQEKRHDEMYGDRYEIQ